MTARNTRTLRERDGCTTSPGTLRRPDAETLDAPHATLEEACGLRSILACLPHVFSTPHHPQRMQGIRHGMRLLVPPSARSMNGTTEGRSGTAPHEEPTGPPADAPALPPLDSIRRTSPAVTHDLRQALERMLHEATETFEAEGGALLVRLPGTDYLSFLLAQGPGAPRIRHMTVPLDNTEAGRCLRSCAPRIYDADTPHTTDDRPDMRLPARAGVTLHNLVTLPLQWEGSGFGVLQLANRKGQAFNEVHAAALGRLADSMAPLVQRLLDTPAMLLEMGLAPPVRRQGTVLVADISSHSALFAAPYGCDETAGAFIRAFHERLLPVVRAGGNKVNVNGDGFTTVYGRDGTATMAERAFRDALELKSRFARLVEEMHRDRVMPPGIGLRIAITTGTFGVVGVNGITGIGDAGGDMPPPPVASPLLIGEAVSRAQHLCEMPFMRPDRLAICDLTYLQLQDEPGLAFANFRQRVWRKAPGTRYVVHMLDTGRSKRRRLSPRGHRTGCVDGRDPSRRRHPASPSPRSRRREMPHEREEGDERPRHSHPGDEQRHGHRPAPPA